ncbi:MAG: transcriptional regulator [Deltaproteobacteria bacterium]|nr:transcriptional regulator [Deltaproteobacteria bacterium]
MPKAKKLTHAARVLRIRELLDARPFLTVDELRGEFGVSRRTVYNDLEALEAAGIPIFSEPGPAGEARWQLVPAAKKQTVTLAAGQLLPFGLAKLALSFLKGTEIHGQLELIMDRLAQGLSPQSKRYLGQLANKVAIVPHGPKSYEAKADVLDDLLSGLLYDQLVELWYRAPGKASATKHKVAPLSLVLYREALYLIGESLAHKTRLIFAVERITRSAWLKGQAFEYPADYSPAQFMDGSFGLLGGAPTDVELLFDAEQARYVRERRWHPTQAFEDLPDGRVRMTMRVSGTFDVLLWLLGHTGAMEVVAPPELRQQVRARLETALARHKRPGRITQAAMAVAR